MTFDEIIRGACGARRHFFPAGIDAPLFTADWHGALFAHFTIDPQRLQPSIPFELDTWQGRGYVSLVAFTQSNLRPSVGGPLASWLIAPIARHAFLNLRTYVRVGGVRGIYFIAEWIPNRLAVLLGPRTYGLPYRLGRLRYENDPTRRRLRGRVCGSGSDGGAFAYEADYPASFAAARGRSLDEFLLERYVAFTRRGGVSRRFLVDHAPWQQQRVDLRRFDCGIMQLAGDWAPHARFIAAHFSPGVSGVTIGAPRALDGLPKPLSHAVEPPDGLGREGQRRLEV